MDAHDLTVCRVIDLSSEMSQRKLILFGTGLLVLEKVNCC